MNLFLKEASPLAASFGKLHLWRFPKEAKDALTQLDETSSRPPRPPRPPKDAGDAGDALPSGLGGRHSVPLQDVRSPKDALPPKEAGNVRLEEERRGSECAAAWASKPNTQLPRNTSVPRRGSASFGILLGTYVLKRILDGDRRSP